MEFQTVSVSLFPIQFLKNFMHDKVYLSFYKQRDFCLCSSTERKVMAPFHKGGRNYRSIDTVSLHISSCSFKAQHATKICVTRTTLTWCKLRSAANCSEDEMFKKKCLEKFPVLQRMWQSVTNILPKLQSNLCIHFF